ncbi:Zinc finger PHD-finger [Penicillium hispanicum]|uniref:Zinc finger PHD-finger n=1 Tax=Penicillium hispanicum TaxID=1080232 RepID=UPI00254189B2|nr:Zinc finger PHD-finger [Penicillium hispanicum]KAJ5578760.1 Zinc finger PHD-finger [Penicillium hispanicum]
MFSFSYPNGEPQTPTRTPTTAALDSFTTPKLESSFFDPRVTWDTADPYASSPEFLRSPQKFGLGTPSNPLRAGSLDQRVGDAANLKEGRSSEHMDTVRRIRPVKPPAGASEDGPRTVDSAKSAASMQTPPPTSASRRKIPDFEPVRSAGRGTSPRMRGHLETPSRLLGASPRMFANLQSSPDLFQLAALDPTGSPFFPQQRLFWDQDHDQPTNDIPLPSTAGSIDHPEQPNLDPSLNAHNIPQLPTIDGSMDLPEFSSGFGISTAPPTDAALFPAPFSTSPRVPVAKAEDPAMFLSSPARRFGGPHLTPERRPLRGLRQPYHHQAEESKREELRRAQGDRQNPGSFSSVSEEDEDDDYTPRGGRPGLTRSVTHTAITSSSHRPLSQAGGMMASTSGIRKSPSKGRASPAKGIRPLPLGRSNSLASGFPTRSQSVVLRIGSDGRAKAEMQPVDEGPTGLTDPLTGMDLDGSTTESEADPAEYSEYPVLPRAQSSFSLFDGARPTLSRSDSGSRPPSKGSYTSTVGSSHSGRMSPWPGSSRGATGRATYRGSPEAIKRTPKRHSSLLHSDASYTRGSVASQSLPGEEDDSGDAQHALRQVLKGRGRGPRPSTGGYGARLSRSSHTFAHLRSSPPRLHSDFDLHSAHSNASPTTLTDPDLATPHTDRHSNPSNGTRCICNSMDNGGHLMIQCESCTHWLHTKCVGLERSNLPSFYVCMFCDHTPSRQNRVRSGYGSGGGPPSPLAHKSFRFR